ncbi:MAG: glutamine--fructose-6-phosphate transaminase (isomerizing) [Candidatus Micrarchaeota archaeon]
MCGIIGYLGFRPVGKVAYSGLKALEYRGYDSAGVAVLESDSNGSSLKIFKDTGKVDEINSRLKLSDLAGSVAVGHVRWATHGGVTSLNAHPHVSCDGAIAVAHNGIIENFLELKKELGDKGHEFSSQTDTEVIPHLIEEALKANPSGGLEGAVLDASRKLKGSFAFLVISKANPDGLIAVRNESPLVVGVGEGEVFAASDCVPFLEFTKKVVFLNDGEMAVLNAGEMRFVDFRSGKQVLKQISEVKWNAEQAQKGDFTHFMMKEISEEPVTLKQSAFQNEEVLRSFSKELLESRNVIVVASGTSFHASLFAKHVFRKLLGKELNVVLASEFGVEAEHLTKDSLLIAVSQSGETADVLACVRKAREKGARVFSIVNVVGSTLDRTSDKTLYLNCGPEIGVAATKSFLNQLGVFLAVAFAAKGKDIDFDALSSAVQQGVDWNKDVLRSLARDFKFKEHVYFLGRGVNYAIAMEGALKLKEISYIHAEGMPAGELKHGTLALVEKGTPVVLLNPHDETFVDCLNNGIEAKSRGAKIIGVSDGENANYDVLIRLPKMENPLLYAVVEVVPLQLLAYYSAVERGRDPDKPRNLAKSVTVL